MKKTLTLALLGCLCAAPGAMGADSAFKWAPRAKGAPAEWQKAITPSRKSPRTKATAADHQLPAAESFGYLDMPDGSTWFITVELNKEVISESPYYTDYDIKGFTATVYNDMYQPVGRIEDTFELSDEFEKCIQVQFGAQVTKKFFNTDDAYEVMLMTNFKPKDEYGAIAKTMVYSLRGADANAEKIQTIDGYYVAAVNNATDSWSEDFFIEFFTGEKYTDTSMVYSFDIYTKASWSAPEATSLKHFDVDMMYVMSDGENETLPVMLNSQGRNLYVTVARYEKTFFEDPFDYTNNNLSPDNHYIIELWGRYGYEQELTLKNTTSIACETPGDGYAMRSYCIGQFSGYEDITFDFTSDGTPAYIVSMADSDYQENSVNFFTVFGLDGKPITSFGEGNGGYLHLSSVPGKPEQYCFIKSDSGTGEIYYSFVNYPSMEEVSIIPANVRAGELNMTLSMSLDRTTAGGSYNYVFADTQGLTDDNGDTSHPVAWFDAEGNFIRLDKLNAGKDVNLAKPYIAGHALNPWLFNTDSKMEYMMLVQRLDYPGSATAHTELCVVNTDGEMLSQFAFPTSDSAISVSLVNLSSNPAIWLSHHNFDDKLYHTEFISLPLNKLPGAGTEADPYMLATPGDMGLIKYNLAAHYRLAADIDYKGEAFTPVSGSFSGSIDGASHSIRNFTLSDKPMFPTVYGKEEAKASIHDLTISGVTAGATNAILAETTSNTVLSRVHVYKASVESESDDEFGTLVAQANAGTVISECSAVNVDIDRPNSVEVGGIVAVLGNNASIDASYYQGTIYADSEVGGIAATARTTTSTVTDCHVKALLNAKNRIGGIVAISARGLVSRCLVEGEITATEPQGVWSDKEGGNKPMMSVGGVIGYLPAANVSYEDGKPVEPSTEPVVKGCVVALDAINIPTDNPVLAETTHRIVGRSRVNNDPEIIDEIYNPSTYDYEYVWGEPAAPEACLADNYAVDDIDPIHAETAEGLTSTEGKSVAWNELVDGDIFDNLGYQFNGYAAEQPWVYTYNGLPALYFESTVGASMAFNPSEITLNEGETAQVMLELENIEFDALTFDFSDESGCTANPVFITEEGHVVIDIEVLKTGVYTITATNGTLSAVLTVTGTSAIGEITATAGAFTYDGTTLHATDSDIALYNLSGILVASGRDNLSTSSLPAGVYMATATTADGTRSVLKIAVR